MNFRLQLLFPLLVLLISAACEQEDLSQLKLEAKPSLDINYTDLPFEISDIEDRGRRYRYAEDIAYGANHVRNKFDVFTLTGKRPVPLVIYVHAGGFTGGDKRQAYEYTANIRQFLMSGVAFATINYRLLQDTDKGVITSLQDIKRAVQFFRYYAEDFNIDPERIAVFGVSAGAGSALWLATHDDMADPSSSDPVERESSRVTSAVSMAGQATYDLVKWETIFAPFGFRLDDPRQDQELLYDFYGVNSMEEIYSPTLTAYRKNVDMLEMMDGNDAPIYIYSLGEPTPPLNNGELYHHPFHAMAVDEVANKVGIEHQIYMPGMNEMDPMNETAVEFTIRQLKK